MWYPVSVRAQRQPEEEKVMSQTIKGIGNEVTIAESAVQAQIGFLMGKVLTIVEASYSDKEQRKAVKDLIRAAFQDRTIYIHGLVYDVRDVGSVAASRVAE